MSIITISRGTMSGGAKIAEMLAEKLGYRCISREIIVNASDDYGVPEARLYDSIQKGPSIFQKFTCEREKYLAFIQASLCEYAKDDNIVYHGHAGHLLLKGIGHVLRVRISAALEYRIKATRESLGFSEKKAKKYIKSIDKQRAKWTKFLYGMDWRSSELYDLVLNLDSGNHELACEIIKFTVNQPQFQITEESRQAMHNLLISSRVKAAIAREMDPCLDRVTIKADKDNVIIAGRVPTKELIDSIIDIVEKVPGISNIDSRLEIDYRGYGIE